MMGDTILYLIEICYCSGQLPVMTADQPLYVTAKEIQWIKSDEFRGKTLSCVIDDFHIENTFIKCLEM